MSFSELPTTTEGWETARRIDTMGEGIFTIRLGEYGCGIILDCTTYYGITHVRLNLDTNSAESIANEILAYVREERRRND